MDTALIFKIIITFCIGMIGFFLKKYITKVEKIEENYISKKECETCRADQINRLEKGDKFFDELNRKVDDLSEHSANNFRANISANYLVCEVLFKVCEGLGIDCNGIKEMREKFRERLINHVDL